MRTMATEAMMTEATPIVLACDDVVYCEGMITEDAKNKKKTKDIIAD